MGAVLRAIDVFDIDIIGEPIEKWHAHPTREENRVDVYRVQRGHERSRFLFVVSLISKAGRSINNLSGRRSRLMDNHRRWRREESRAG